MTEENPMWQRNEGRRLFELCLKHGAKPGKVHEWLKEKLESIQLLENRVTEAGWKDDFYAQQARDEINEGWK